MRCKNPFCKGTSDFDLTTQETKFLQEYDVDPQNIIYCPQCREARRISWRNERNFFKRKCDSSGKEILSIYSPESPFKIFDKDIWWGDSWEGTSFGQNFDFNRNFFEQFYELMLKVPRPSLVQMRNKNSDFSNDANSNNDCYFVFIADDNVNCHYGSFILCKDCMDCEEVYKCELCYDCIYCNTSNTLVGCEYCINCSGCNFSSNLVNCHNCIFCYGLRDKRNCIFNTEVSAEVFQNFMLYRQLFRRFSYKKAKEMFLNFLETAPQRYMYLLKVNNSTGDRLINCIDCGNCYSMENAVNCVNVTGPAVDLKDCMDCWMVAYGPEKSFENQTCLRGGYNFVGNFSNDCSGCFYVDNCQNCQNCFGCIGLKNKKNCIFNKQYSPSAYEKLKDELVVHMKKTREWGNFFPFWMSPFPYNKTVANIYYPMEKDEHSKLVEISEELFKPSPKYKKENMWHEINVKSKKKEKEQILLSPPDSIYEAKNGEVLNTIYYDIKTNEPFRIIGRELAFYQRMRLPLPENAFSTRYRERLKRFNNRKLYERKCNKCSKEISTTFPPDSPYIIFCEECYVNSMQLQ